MRILEKLRSPDKLHGLRMRASIGGNRAISSPFDPFFISFQASSLDGRLGSWLRKLILTVMHYEVL